jgi:hypothetical protein
VAGVFPIRLVQFLSCSLAAAAAVRELSQPDLRMQLELAAAVVFTLLVRFLSFQEVLYPSELVQVVQVELRQMIARVSVDIVAQRHHF